MNTQTVSKNQEVVLTKHELKCAREWVKDCVWRDVESEEDVDDMSDLQIQRGIKRHYCGGIEEFKRNCEE